MQKPSIIDLWWIPKYGSKYNFESFQLVFRNNLWLTIRIDQILRRNSCKELFKWFIFAHLTSHRIIFIFCYRNDRSGVIRYCAENAQSRNYEYFALQGKGECWAGSNTAKETYLLSGMSNRCRFGLGGQYANSVYKIGSSIGKL